MKQPTNIRDEQIREILERGNLERNTYEEFWIRFRLLVEQDWQPFKQEEIDRIKLPAYLPQGLLKNEKWYWSEVPHDYYQLAGNRYLNQSQITSQGIELNDFFSELENKSNKKLLFKGEKHILRISSDNYLFNLAKLKGGKK